MILKSIELQMGVSYEYLEKVVKTAEHRYKTFTIPKRSSGYRVIEQPSRELKFLQRWLNRNIFRHLPIHSAAYAYRQGIGIAANARVHVNNNYLLKIDFVNFFPSLKRKDVRRLLDVNIQTGTISLEKEDVDVILDIVCKGGGLTIGSPASPVLSNAILYEFDVSVSELCRSRGVTYTRYADDLYFSTNRPGILADSLAEVRNILRDKIHPNLRINEQKTIFSSRKHLRRITGLTLTPDRNISIGRAKKRKIRTLVYLFAQNGISKEELSYLRGYLAFIKSVEPVFLERLRKKFGGEVVERILSTETIPRKSAPTT